MKMTMPVMQVYRQVFKKATLDQRKGLSVGQFIETNVTVIIIIVIIIIITIINSLYNSQLLILLSATNICRRCCIICLLYVYALQSL